MDEKKLTEYVTVLNQLPDEIKNNIVDMNSYSDPACGTPGCHGGLISIVSKYLPELQQKYDFISKYKNQIWNGYSHIQWSYALALYLGFTLEQGHTALNKWASDNPVIWGNRDGYDMFFTGKAFGQESGIFPHRVIIDHFTAMSDRLNKKLEQKR